MIKENTAKEYYLGLMKKRLELVKIIDTEEFESELKKILDSRFIKFINVKKRTIVLRANKKLREKIEKDKSYLEEYIWLFLHQVFKEIGMTILPTELSIIADISMTKSDYKIYITL